MSPEPGLFGQRAVHCQRQFYIFLINDGFALDTANIMCVTGFVFTTTTTCTITMRFTPGFVPVPALSKARTAALGIALGRDASIDDRFFDNGAYAGERIHYRGLRAGWVALCGVPL